jgi:hypothetical protein
VVDYLMPPQQINTDIEQQVRYHTLASAKLKQQLSLPHTRAAHTSNSVPLR